jgi:hypothetical protein
MPLPFSAYQALDSILSPLSLGLGAAQAAMPLGGPGTFLRPGGYLEKLFKDRPEAQGAMASASAAHSGEAAETGAASVRRLEYLMKKLGIQSEEPWTPPPAKASEQKANLALRRLDKGEVGGIIPTENGFSFGIPLPNRPAPTGPIREGGLPASVPPSGGSHDAGIRASRLRVNAPNIDTVRKIRDAATTTYASLPLNQVITRLRTEYPDISEGSLRSILKGDSFVEPGMKTRESSPQERNINSRWKGTQAEKATMAKRLLEEK